MAKTKNGNRKGAHVTQDEQLLETPKQDEFKHTTLVRFL